MLIFVSETRVLKSKPKAMKKLFFILTVAIALVALDLAFPTVEIEQQVGSFLRNNLAKVVSWVNLAAIA
jgi:hypothetical protein